jgi:hypothetical protein
LFPSLREWLGEVFDELFAIDAKLPRTLRKLLWPPGELTVEWRRGRRMQYVAPFRLYLATAFPFFLAWTFTPFGTVLQSSAAGFMEGFAGGQGQVGRMAMPGDHRFEVAVQVLSDNLPGLVMVFFVPVFAGLLLAVTRGSGRFVGSLITAFHIHTLGFLAMILTVPVNLLFGADTGQVLALVLLLGPHPRERDRSGRRLGSGPFEGVLSPLDHCCGLYLIGRMWGLRRPHRLRSP